MERLIPRGTPFATLRHHQQGHAARSQPVATSRAALPETSWVIAKMRLWRSKEVLSTPDTIAGSSTVPARSLIAAVDTYASHLGDDQISIDQLPSSKKSTGIAAYIWRSTRDSQYNPRTTGQRRIGGLQDFSSTFLCGRSTDTGIHRYPESCNARIPLSRLWVAFLVRP